MLDGEIDDKTDKAEPISDEALALLLDKLNRDAVGHLSDEVAADQDNALDRYMGKPYGDEEEGQSQAMSMDVAEVVDWALPDLLEPFISGERAVEFQAGKPEHDSWIEQANDLANHVFYSENDGTTFLHDTIKTALIQKIGYSKTYWKPEEKVETRTVSGWPLLAVLELQKDQTKRIVSQTAEPVGEMEDPTMAAAFEDGLSYTVTVEHTVKCGKMCLESIPPEEIKVASRSADIHSLDYIAHEVELPKWKLIDMGFDADKVAELGSTDAKTESTRADHRFSDEARSSYENHLKNHQIVTLIEEYPLIDMDGSGKAERWQVFRVGKTILAKEQVDAHPFDAWTADRIPHRLIGLALADKVKQTQRIKTHLTRDLLNNIYLANRPRFEVPDTAIGKNTIADLLNHRIGGLIRVKMAGQLQPITVPDRSATALTAITYMDGVREQQSGITRNGLAVSSEVVDPKSATESNRQSRNEQVRKRLMCRMIAETFLVPVFRKVLKGLVSYQDAEKAIQVHGKWIATTPSQWDADITARAAVGLGHSNRDEELAAAQLIAQFQMEARAMGMATPKHLYKTAAKLVRAVGWRNPEDYFVNPDSEEGQQALAQHAQSAGQDPKMIEVQMKAQAQQEAQQAKMQAEQAKLSARAQEVEIKAQVEQMKAQLKAQMDGQIKEFEASLEAKLALRQQDMERDLSIYEIDRATDAKMHAATQTREKQLSNVQFGGEIG